MGLINLITAGVWRIPTSVFACIISVVTGNWFTVVPLFITLIMANFLVTDFPKTKQSSMLSWKIEP